jgi:hypothetical protein
VRERDKIGGAEREKKIGVKREKRCKREGNERQEDRLEIEKKRKREIGL